MSVKRRDLIKYLKENGFRLIREGGSHSIYSNEIKAIPVKRHSPLDRITANECQTSRVKAKVLIGRRPELWKKSASPDFIQE